jgi:hypothetical protein
VDPTPQPLIGGSVDNPGKKITIRGVKYRSVKEAAKEMDCKGTFIYYR